MDASNSESQPPAGPGTGVDGGKTPKKGKDDGPSINVTMPSKEWIDDLWGPMMIVEEDENDEQNQNTSTESKSRSRTPQLATTISTNTRPKSKSNKAHDVVVISDDEEEKEKNNQTVKSNENMELEIIENPNNTGKRNGHLSDEFSTREENIDNENKAKPSEIRQIVLTRAQISQFAKCNNALFRKAVIGCYVRFNAPSILPDKSKDLLFLDQIIDILEPQSYQHFWFNRRFRLKYFGDFQIEQIHELAIQKDTELRAWFCCMEAKGIPIPSHEFVKRKKLELLAAQKEIETKNIAPTPTKTRITRTDLSKIVLNQDTLSSLSKLPFEQFKKAVVGNFVCIQALRTGMPDDCQYHIIRVADCTQRREEYKVGNISIVNYQLVLPFYGNYIIPWLRTNFKNQPIPTVAEINEKAAELQMALTEAESIPDYAQKKKKQKEEEEKQKRANLPIRFAIDLDKNLLKQQNLQKLAILAQKDFDLFEKTMVGSFVRLKVGAKQFQVDRIRALELVELKPPIQNEEDEIIFDEKWEPTFEEKVSIELKYGGGTSLKELIGNSSAFNIAQTEFDEWLRKMHDDPLCRPIPTYALIEKKEEENNRALELAEKLAAEQKKSNESTNTTQSKNKSRNVDEEVRILGTSNNGAALLPKIPKKPINEDGGRSRGGGPSYSQPNQWKPRREVRETPGIRSGWMNSTTSSSSTIAPLRQQWQRQTGQNEFNRPQRWTTPQPLSQRLISEPNQINFVRERNPWVPSGEQHQQIQNLLNSRLSRYDQPSGPPPAMAIPGQSPAAFFGTSRNNIANSANNEQIQMERSLGFYHDQFGRIGSNPAVASSSTAFAASDDALRRAIPNDRLPQLINQRGLSSSMSSSSAGYAAHYNAAPSYTQPTFFSSAAPKRARQSSPQAPPVHRIF